jgi:hypothetical protein
MAIWAIFASNGPSPIRPLFSSADLSANTLRWIFFSNFGSELAVTCSAATRRWPLVEWVRLYLPQIFSDCLKVGRAELGARRYF